MTRRIELSLVPFAELAPSLSDDLTLLTRAEQDRAQRFQTRALRERFIASRACIRRLIARRLGQPPRQIRFHQTRTGKQVLDQGPHFSVSHTRQWLAVAVCDTHETGIDIEAVPTGNVVRDLMRTCCSEEEQTRLISMTDEAARCRAFARLWTRKEALVKAEGSGLRIGLNRLTVNTQSGCRDALSGSRHEAIDPQLWRVMDLPAIPDQAEDLVGAVAIAGRASAEMSLKRLEPGYRPHPSLLTGRSG